VSRDDNEMIFERSASRCGVTCLLLWVCVGDVEVPAGVYVSDVEVPAGVCVLVMWKCVGDVEVPAGVCVLVMWKCQLGCVCWYCGSAS
jgi:hypothetical protein